MDIRELCAYACIELVKSRGVRCATHHWLDIGMWYCVKLVVLELKFRSDVDVGSLVFCSIAIPGGRKDYG